MKGSTLKRARKRSGLSQFDLAVKSGVTLGIIRNLEQGITVDVRFSTAKKLAKALKVSLDDLSR